MITEDYCSPEVSKILREKGLGQEHFSHYVQVCNGDGTVEAISVCTHQIAMKWLRGKRIHIEITSTLSSKLGFRFRPNIYDYNKNHHEGLEEVATFEAAVDAALKYSLENLI